MNNIEELVKKHFDRWVTDTEFGNVEVHLRAALTEQAETHAIELRACEATVQNLEQRIDELTGVRLTVGDGLSVYGTGEAIRRAQAYILLDSSHPSEANGTARHFANALQAAEQRIRELEKEQDELGKDAARYQFIRALENDAVAIQLVKSECDVDLDAAIDAAIAQEKVE